MEAEETGLWLQILEFMPQPHLFLAALLGLFNLPKPQFLHLWNQHDMAPLLPELNNVRYARFKAHMAHFRGVGEHQRIFPTFMGKQFPFRLLLQLVAFMKCRYLQKEENN